MGTRQIHRYTRKRWVAPCGGDRVAASRFSAALHASTVTGAGDLAVHRRDYFEGRSMARRTETLRAPPERWTHSKRGANPPLVTYLLHHRDSRCPLLPFEDGVFHSAS